MQAGQTTIERTMGITIDGSLGSSYMGSTSIGSISISSMGGMEGRVY
ncbi:MAG: hypothetical protein AAFV07_21595 [Bacteroidota bacterium]